MANIGTSSNISKVRMAEQGSDPAAPAAGFSILYLLASGVLKVQNSAASIYQYVTTAHTHAGTTNGPKLAQANTHESPDTDAAVGSLHHTIGVTATSAAAGNHTHSGVNSDAGISVIIGDGVNAITTGLACWIEVPWGGAITAVRLAADAVGSIVVDIWNSAYADLPAADADSITAAAPPTLSSAQFSEDATLTGWTVAMDKGDWLYFNVDSATTVKQVTLSLTITKS